MLSVIISQAIFEIYPKSKIHSKSKKLRNSRALKQGVKSSRCVETELRKMLQFIVEQNPFKVLQKILPFSHIWLQNYSFLAWNSMNLLQVCPYYLFVLSTHLGFISNLTMQPPFIILTLPSFCLIWSFSSIQSSHSSSYEPWVIPQD